LRALDRLLTQHGFDVLHAHLTYDHWLARFVARDRAVRVARTFHSRRVLRGDPFSRSLLRATHHRFVINRAFDVPGAVFTPPPVDHRQFHPDGPRIELEGPIVTVIGKLSAGRGFEEAIRTFAVLRGLRPCRLMIIGHGEHRPVLEELVRSLDLVPHVIFAGYHEDDLAEHYRASDLLLFTARGSDEGHRAVLEAMACGIPVATMPIEGVDALVPASWIAPANEPAALASTAAKLLASPPGDAYELSRAFGYDRAAERLLAAYAV
jgi:glycosyltransferase involved in cell wall biosynthesis